MSLTCRTTGLYWGNQVKMEKSDTEPKLFSTTKKSENTPLLLSPDVTVNQIFHANPHHDGFIPSCCMDPYNFCQKIPCRVGQVNQELRQPARAAQHNGLQRGEPEDGGATPAGMNVHPGDKKRECCYWKCGPNQCGATGPANRGAAWWGTWEIKAWRKMCLCFKVY